MEKETFIFRTKWKKTFEVLTPEDCKQLILIICDYVENLTKPNKPNLSDRLLMAWLFIEDQLNTDKIKYDKRCETSKINGKKGGRPKNLNNLKKPKKADNEYDSDYEYDSDIKKEENIKEEKCLSFMENNFGRTVSPFEYETITYLVEDFGEELVLQALQIAVERNAKNLSYVKATLNNWKSSGTTLSDILEERQNKENSAYQPKFKKVGENAFQLGD